MVLELASMHIMVFALTFVLRDGTIFCVVHVSWFAWGRAADFQSPAVQPSPAPSFSGAAAGAAAMKRC